MKNFVHSQPSRQKPQDSLVRRHLGTWIAAAAFGLLGLIVILMVALIEADPVRAAAEPGRSLLESFYSQVLHYDALLWVSSAFTALILFAYALAPRRFLGVPALRVSVAIIGVALVFSSGFTYLYARHGVASRDYPHLHDSFHYLLGAKYFDEVGYFDFYDCVVVADRESAGKLPPAAEIRNLRTYRYTPANLSSQNVDCRSMFTPERWGEFKQDIEVFSSRYLLLRVLRDRGYNGTPFHTFVAGGLAGFVPVSFESLNYLALIDVLAICLLMIVISRAFGWPVGLLFGIFFFVNFSDRFVFIGGSYLRYLWMVCLGLGIACLRRKRFGLAGGLIATAALFNVFPLLFLAGPGLKALVTLVRTRSLPDHYRRFILAAVATALIGAGLGVTHGKGLDNYRDFLSFIGMHSETLTYSRTGFHYDFLFRGEVTRSDPDYSYMRKNLELMRIKPVVRGIAALVLLLGFAIIIRLDDVEATALGGFLLFFFLFGTVEYYYAVAAVLVLLWYRRLEDRAGALFLGLLFAWNAVVLIVYRQTGFIEFCNNTLMSIGLTSYLLGSLVYLGFDTGFWRDSRRFLLRQRSEDATPLARRPAFEAAAVLLALAVPPATLWIWWTQFAS